MELGVANPVPALNAPAVADVSDGEKADLIRQVSDEKVSASKPLMTHRNAFQLLSKRDPPVMLQQAHLSVRHQPAHHPRDPAGFL